MSRSMRLTSRSEKDSANDAYPDHRIKLYKELRRITGSDTDSGISRFEKTSRLRLRSSRDTDR
jgi:hypothetical protein